MTRIVSDEYQPQGLTVHPLSFISLLKVFDTVVKPNERALLTVAYRKYDIKIQELRRSHTKMATDLGNLYALTKSSCDSLAQKLEGNLKQQHGIYRELQFILHTTVDPKRIAEAGLLMYPAAMSSVEVILRCMPRLKIALCDHKGDHALGDHALSAMAHGIVTI